MDMHALSLTSPMVYWATPEFGLKLSRVFNDACAEVHQKYPTRFVGMATVPMQAPELAVRKLLVRRSSPAYAASTWRRTYREEPRREGALARVCQVRRLGLPIFLHPTAPVGRERMRKYHLGNFLGNPYETGIAAASLMFGGVLDAFPKLDIMLPHAGGAFPNLIGRMDHGTTVRAECKHMTKAPSTYLRRFHYDTITHSDGS